MNTLVFWFSDALTEFANGCIRGVGAGVVVGGAAAAQTDTLDAHALSCSAAIGFIVAAASNGLKAVVVWHHTHPMPNPLRAPAAPTSSNPDGTPDLRPPSQ